MQVNILGKDNSLFNHFIAELRDVNIHNDTMRFRRNLERIGEVAAIEISRHLNYEAKEIQTPLGKVEEQLISDEIVLATILRAGLPLHQGLLNYFDRANSGFISAYRKHTNDGEFEVEVEYLSAPAITDKVLVLSDPMLATGQSMALSYQAILTHGEPKHTHIVAAIGSAQGVDYIKDNLPDNVTLWMGTIDPELNSKAYIVPGLGDAGDLAFGEKV